MGKKLNLDYRDRNARRLAQQVACIFCRKRTNPRYLTQTENGPAHRHCIETARLNAQEAHEKRERERAAHLAVKDWWIRSRPEGEGD
jgi:hypothetical protein